MSSNIAASASADSEHYTLRLCVVNHEFIITSTLLMPKVQQGMLVADFLKAVLAEYPGTFDRGTAALYYLSGGFMFPVRQTKKAESEGWLEISSDQIFTRNGEDLEGDPDRMLWIEIPDNSARKVFYVIKNPGKVIQSYDEDTEWTVEKRLPLLYDKRAPALSRSALARMGPSQLHKSKFEDHTNYNCPRETKSISLTLLSEVFSRFKDDCNLEPDSEMSQALATYAKAALAIAEDLSQPVGENLLMSNINSLFEDLYDLTSVRRDIPPYEMDGHFAKNGRMQLLKEVKSRNPSGDALVQGTQYYRKFYMDRLKPRDHLPEGDILPAFFITYQGPLINVYGIAFVEDGQVQCEYLTSVNAGCHWTNKEELYKLTQILYALRKALDRLDELPEVSEAPTSPPRKRQKIKRPTQKVWPYPHTFTELGSGRNVEFQYLKRLDGERYLFEVQPVTEPPSKRLLVKFVQSYGRAVHEELASVDYAPKLHGFTELSGGWKMVVMEYLESPVWRDGTSLPVGDQVVQRELVTVRNEILPSLKEKGYVHGDIRLDNLMFRMDRAGNGSDPAVKLVDFDFAGEAGKTTYPWNLNTAIRLHGEVPCAPLEFLHDNGSLDIIAATPDSLQNGAGLLHSEV